MWVTRGKIWDVRRIYMCFPAKSLKRIPHQIGSMGTGVVMQKDDSVGQHSRALRFYSESQHPQTQRNEPHLSALLCLPTFPMLDEHILHYYLLSNKETTVLTCASSLACFLAYRWLLLLLGFTTLFNILGHQHRFRYRAWKVRQILLGGSNFGLRFFYVP